MVKLLFVEGAARRIQALQSRMAMLPEKAIAVRENGGRKRGILVLALPCLACTDTECSYLFIDKLTHVRLAGGSYYRILPMRLH